MGPRSRDKPKWHGVKHAPPTLLLCRPRALYCQRCSHYARLLRWAGDSMGASVQRQATAVPAAPRAVTRARRSSAHPGRVNTSASCRCRLTGRNGTAAPSARPSAGWSPLRPQGVRRQKMRASADDHGRRGSFPAATFKPRRWQAYRSSVTLETLGVRTHELARAPPARHGNPALSIPSRARARRLRLRGGCRGAIECLCRAPQAVSKPA